ncbi:hypothetical protein ACSTTR_002937 [Serratia marcescens]
MDNKLSEPVAWTVGGFASHDKKWAERRSAEENLLLEPLYRHPVVTGIDENHYDPELEPGLYVAEIMTKGGAAVINGYYTAPPAPAVPKEMTIEQSYENVQTWHYANGWNACRAAMLAQPVSSGYKLPDNVREALTLALQAMEFMGDTLNNIDAVCTEDVEFVTPAFTAVRELLAAAPEGGNG